MRDMTEYKYKYFTGLDSFSFDKENPKAAFENPTIYLAVCVKECPKASAEKIAAGEKIDCMINNDVRECPTYTDSAFLDTTLQFNYCIPKTDKAEEIVKEMYA